MCNSPPLGGFLQGLVRQLAPVTLFDTRPKYFIYAGLVFVVLSQPFLRSAFGKDWESR